jgi:hypothetical protein
LGKLLQDFIQGSSLRCQVGRLDGGNPGSQRCCPGSNNFTWDD